MFFSHEVGMEFQEFGFGHIMTIVITIVGLVLLFIYRKQLKDFKYEKQLRWGIAIFAFVWEIGLYIFRLTENPVPPWNDIVPFGSLCGITLYVGIAILMTKSYKLYEIGYFWTWGAIASLLFPDIPYSFDRYRFYQFMIGHAFFFYMFAYMMFVHNFIPTFKSYLKSAATLFTITIVYIGVNALLNVNFLFLSESEGTPFEIFEFGSKFLYIVLVIITAAVVMFAWLGIARLYKKLSNSPEYEESLKQ